MDKEVVIKIPPPSIGIPQQKQEESSTETLNVCTSSFKRKQVSSIKRWMPKKKKNKKSSKASIGDEDKTLQRVKVYEKHKIFDHLKYPP